MKDSNTEKLRLELRYFFNHLKSNFIKQNAHKPKAPLCWKIFNHFFCLANKYFENCRM